jgi:hypothetical protein
MAKFRVFVTVEKDNSEDFQGEGGVPVDFAEGDGDRFETVRDSEELAVFDTLEEVNAYIQKLMWEQHDKARKENTQGSRGAN